MLAFLFSFLELLFQQKKYETKKKWKNGVFNINLKIKINI
jgi:hypothetical protein